MLFKIIIKLSIHYNNSLILKKIIHKNLMINHLIMMICLILLVIHQNLKKIDPILVN